MGKYEVELLEDGDDLILQFPPEMLEEVGWKEGDELLWDVSEEGYITLSLSKQLRLF